ncbi:MAG TPA: DPP IV N-terminal domain-containing protein [Bacteroidota bacterium]
MNTTKAFAFIALSVALFGCQEPTVPALFHQSWVHVQPSWSNDGKTVAFSATIHGTAGIYLVDTTGLNVRLLHAGNDAGCSWSPDSKWLAFMENNNLFEISSAGDSLIPLTTSGLDLFPAWSPDGKKIAFNRYNLGIYIRNLETSQDTSVFQSGEFASWHPNGDLVAISQLGAGSDGSAVYGFYAMRADTAVWRTLTTLVVPGLCTTPAVSPADSTEKEIVFSLTQSVGYTELWKIDLSSGNVIQLTDDGGDYPAWSPDGSKIVYTRTQQGDGGLWIMNADGSGKYRLTSP